MIDIELSTMVRNEIVEEMERKRNMVNMQLKLDTVDKVKEFVSIISKEEDDYDLMSEDKHFVVDAKSIMGIFSLNLSKPVMLTSAHADKDRAKVIFEKFVA